MEDYKTIGSKSLSYSGIREAFKEMSNSVASNLKLKLHSLSSGGASTSTAADNNVSDRCISKHSRWKSDKGRDAYINDSVPNKLEITKNKGGRFVLFRDLWFSALHAAF